MIAKIKYLVLPFLFILTACGNSGDNGAFSDNIFLLQNDSQTVGNLNVSLMGLWQSDAYSDQGVVKQFRWKVTEDKMILAKKCTLASGHVYYAQVSIALENEDLMAMSNLSPFAVPVKSQDQVIDIELMTQNRPCRVSIDPKKIASHSVVGSGTDEIQVTSQNFEIGHLDLVFTEENKAGKLTKISN